MQNEAVMYNNGDVLLFFCGNKQALINENEGGGRPSHQPFFVYIASIHQWKVFRCKMKSNKCSNICHLSLKQWITITILCYWFGLYNCGNKINFINEKLGG